VLWFNISVMGNILSSLKSVLPKLKTRDIILTTCENRPRRCISEYR
jgi:hypothetical protein